MSRPALAASIALLAPKAFANANEPSPPLFATSDADGRGVVYQFRRGDVSHAALMVRLPSDAAPELVNALAGVAAAMSIYAETANRLVRQLLPSVLVEELRKKAVDIFRPPYLNLERAAISETTAVGAAWARISTPEAPDAARAILQAQYRELWRSLNRSQQAARIKNADIEELAALITGKSMFDFDHIIWTAIEDRFAKLNTIRLHQLGGAFNRVPTIGNAIATGPDQERIEAEAEALINGHKRRLETLDMVRKTMTGIITVVAVSIEMQPDATYKLITGRGE